MNNACVVEVRRVEKVRRIMKMNRKKDNYEVYHIMFSCVMGNLRVVYKLVLLRRVYRSVCSKNWDLYVRL